MKKCYLFCFVLLLFVLNLREINAASYICIDSGYHSSVSDSSNCSSGKKVKYQSDKDEHIYDISSLSFTSDKKLLVEGFSFLSGYSNSSNGYWLVLFQKNSSGDWQTYVSDKVDGSGGDGSGNDSRKLSALTYVNSSCSSEVKVAAKNVKYELLLNTHVRYSNSNGTCGLGKDLASGYTVKTYSNVEFSINVNLETLQSVFSSNRDIELRLLMKRGDNYYLKRIYAVNSEIAVAAGLNNTVIKSNSVTSDNQPKAKMISSGAYIRNSNNKFRRVSYWVDPDTNNCSDYSGSDKIINDRPKCPVRGKFKNGSEFYILGVSSTKYSPRLYKLAFKTGSSGYTTENGIRIYKPATSSDLNDNSKYDVGYAYATWLNIDGSVKFQLVDPPCVESVANNCCGRGEASELCKPDEPEPDCTVKPCVGSNCEASYSVISENNCPVINDTSTVIGGVGANKEITGCSITGESDNSSIERRETKTLYYKVSNGKIIVNEKKVNGVTIVGQTFDLTCDSNLKIGSDVYIPVEFVTKVAYNQSYTFKVTDFTTDSIAVRRGFPFKFLYNVSYSRTLKSSVIGTSANNSYTTENNSYVGTSNVYVKNGSSCSGPTTLYVRLTGDDYLYDSVGNVVGQYKNIYNTNVFNQKTSVYDIDENDVLLTFPNSSDVNENDFTTNDDFSCVESTNGYSCNYDLPVAYWNKNTNIYPEIVYGNSYAADTENYIRIKENDADNNLYYIPYNFTLGSPFEFNIKASNLGIIDGLPVGLNVTCSVNVGNKTVSDKITYRTIDVSNPFPNGVKDNTNWKTYVDSYGTTRINNTFSYCAFGDDGCISYQTNTFLNSDKDSIRDLTNQYGYYSSLESSIVDTGNSNVISLATINGEKLFLKNLGRHNLFGIYDPDQDKTQWER